MSFVGYRLIVVFIGMKYQDKLAEQGAMKNMSEISSSNLLLSSHEVNLLLKKTVYKQIEKGNFAIPSYIQVTFKFMEH